MNINLKEKLKELIDDYSFRETKPLVIVGTTTNQNSFNYYVADDYEELFNQMLQSDAISFNYLDSLYGEVDEEENYSLNINDYKEALFDGLSRSDRFYYYEDNFNEWDKQQAELNKIIEHLIAERGKLI